MAFARRDPNPTVESERDSFKRAVGQERLGEAIVALFDLLATRFPQAEFESIFKSEIEFERSKMLRSIESCLLIAGLELSRKLIIAGSLIQQMKRNMEKHTTVLSRALDSNQPLLFTANFGSNMLDHMRAVLSVYSETPEDIARCLMYNEDYYQEADDLAFSLRSEYSNMEHEKWLRTKLGVVNHDIDVTSLAFRHNLRFEYFTRTIEEEYPKGPLVSMRLRKYMEANNLSWKDRASIEDLDDGCSHLERSTVLMSTFLCLHIAEYFTTEPHEVAFKIRQRIGFPMLGDIQYQTKCRPHRLFLLYSLLNMDRTIRSIFWEYAGDLGIPPFWGSLFELSVGLNRVSEEDSDEDSDETDNGSGKEE
ncbi:hypothetical protein F4810DRAFT_709722 [Camillea tinctor]|nr:hypothetical protein F4810DRAFT_709722 [Camillea tinctor]